MKIPASNRDEAKAWAKRHPNTIVTYDKLCGFFWCPASEQFYWGTPLTTRSEPLNCYGNMKTEWYVAVWSQVRPFINHFYQQRRLP